MAKPIGYWIHSPKIEKICGSNFELMTLASKKQLLLICSHFLAGGKRQNKQTLLLLLTQTSALDLLPVLNEIESLNQYDLRSLMQAILDNLFSLEGKL